MAYILDKDNPPSNSIFGDLDLSAFKKKEAPKPFAPLEPVSLFGDVDTKYLTSTYLYGGQEIDKQIRNAAPDLPAESVTQFEESPEVIERFDRLTDYLGNNDTFMSSLIDPGSWGSNDDVVEFLRDDVVRIGSKLNKAMLMEDAPDQIKEDYRYLQERFDKAELSGVKEYMGAFMDYGTDVIFNPETLVGVLGTIFSGGTGAGGVAAAHKGARLTISKALGKAASTTSINSAKGAAA